MAVQTYSDISGALAAIYRPRIVRTFNARSVLLRVLPKPPGAGKNVTWDVESTGAIGENYADGADVANYGQDALATPVLTWGLYRSNFGVTKLAKDAAGSSPSPAALAALLGRNFENALRKLASTVNGVLYTGAGTGTTICGLAAAIADGNIYAGIDRASAAYWRAKVFDPGVSTAPTLKMLRGDISDIYDACGEKPDVAVCSSAVWQKIASLFDDARRYNVEVVNTAAGAVTLDASVSAINIDGCVFLADKDCTANAIYYLNSNYVRAEYLPAADAALLPEIAREAAADDGYGEIPLGMVVEQLAKTGAASKYSLMVTCQLVVEKPSACGKRLNVAT